MKNIILISLSFILSISAYSQYTEKELNEILANSSTQKLVQENTQMLLVKVYNQSIRIADKLLESAPENANFNYRKGYALLYSNSDYMLSIPYLQKANKSVSKNYDGSSGKETNAPIDVIYHLAHAYHLSGQVDSAIILFQKFIQTAPKDNEIVSYAQFEITQCAVAKEAMENPKNYRLKNVGATINASTPDYSPVISLDGNSLYFTSRRLWEDSSNIRITDPSTGFYFEDIYLSYKDEQGEWTEPKRLNFCRNNQMEATVSISSDERVIYTYEDRTGNGDIYFSKYAYGEFDDVAPYEVKDVNTNAWETHLVVTPDGNNIYFVSDREGGFGGRDIYRIVKLPNGEWSKPMNLGPTINTPYDEDAPFIAVDNKSLYFASNNEKSMGGFDIFLSIRDDENQWSSPINLGYPLNSTADDIFYTTTFDGLTGYLTSVRRDGFGDKDIYEIKNDEFRGHNIAILKGRIKTVGHLPLPDDITVDVVCLDCGETSERTVLPRVRDGSFFSGLDDCRKYELVYKSEQGQKEFYRQNIETECDKDYQEVKVEILLRLEDMTVIPFEDYYLAGNVRQKSTSVPMPGVKVEILDMNDNLLETLITDASGNFDPKVLAQKSYDDTLDYKIRLSKDDYLTQMYEFHDTLGQIQTIDLEYTLEKMDVGIDIGKVLSLQPINFDLNSHKITPTAAIELDKIVKIMNDNPTIKIELSSHTDCRGSAQYNMALSQRRAKSSADYVQSRISNPSRIYGKGYGESKLLNDCGCEGDKTSDCTEEEHAVNRRTEFTIVNKK